MLLITFISRVFSLLYVMLFSFQYVKERRSPRGELRLIVGLEPTCAADRQLIRLVFHGCLSVYTVENIGVEPMTS